MESYHNRNTGLIFLNPFSSKNLLVFYRPSLQHSLLALVRRLMFLPISYLYLIPYHNVLLQHYNRAILLYSY